MLTHYIFEFCDRASLLLFIYCTIYYKIRFGLINFLFLFLSAAFIVGHLVRTSGQKQTGYLLFLAAALFFSLLMNAP